MNGLFFRQAALDYVRCEEIRNLVATGISGRASDNEEKAGRKSKEGLVAFLLIAMASAILLLLVGRGPVEVSDFTPFYVAGKIILERKGNHLYDLSTETEIERRVAIGEVRLNTHPPFEAIAFVPFALFPYSVARVLWAFLQLIILGASFYLPREHLAKLGLWSRFLITALLAIPIIGIIGSGQDVAFVLLMSVAAFRFLEHDKSFAAGCCLAAACIKFQFVVPMLVFFAVRKMWHVLAGFSATGLGLVCLSLIVAGKSAFYSYVEILRRQAEILDPKFLPSMPNIRGIVFVSSGWCLNVVWLGLVMILIAAVFARYGNRTRGVPWGFAGIITIAPWLSPHSYVTDVVLLALPAALALGCSEVRNEAFAALWGIVAGMVGLFWIGVGFSLLVPLLAVFSLVMIFGPLKDCGRQRFALKMSK